MNSVSIPEGPKRKSTAFASCGQPTFSVTADQSKERLTTRLRCRQVALQQHQSAQCQLHPFKSELQQWLAAIQVSRSSELEGETRKGDGVAQLKPIGYTLADFEAGADAPQQPAVECVGLIASLRPDSVQLPVTHQVACSQTGTLASSLLLEIQEVAVIHVHG